MNDAVRYAIYYVPAADSAIYRFGAAVLGNDCYAGVDIPYGFDFGLDAAGRKELVRAPQKYGFHATLKAPFSLSSGFSEVDLVNAVDTFSGLGRAVPTITPVVQMLGDFVAIVPRERVPAIDALATDCVLAFDSFRAPMSAQERERRLAPGLTAIEIHNLDRWGYPYVLSEFRFHMSLTGRVPRDRRDPILTSIREEFLRCCGARPIPIDRLTLLRQEHPDARFKIVHQVSIGASR